MQLKCLFFILLLTLFTSCGSNKNAAISAQEEIEIPEVKETPKIVFLYFDIEKAKGENDKITLTETQIVEGKLKENTIINEPKNEGNLILQIIGNNGSVQEEQVIKNPLNQIIEQYGEKGEMNSENVKMDKNQFYMRFNQQKNSKSIKILKINPNQNTELYNQEINL